MSINIKHESNGDSHQITIRGLLQLTTREDGSVAIDLAGRHVEVIRNMPESRLIIQQGERYAFMAPEVIAELNAEEAGL